MIVFFTVARRRRIFFWISCTVPSNSSIFWTIYNCEFALRNWIHLFRPSKPGSITLDGPLVWPGIHQTGGPPNLGSTKPGVHQPRSQKNWGSIKPGVHLLFPEKPGVHGPPVYRWTGGPSATLVSKAEQRLPVVPKPSELIWQSPEHDNMVSKY